MITLDQVKIIREKKKDNPDQINLFGNNSGKKKKYTPPSKEKSDAIQARSANRDAKKYASGEYPKIGGGDRVTPKSKGSGAFTGGISTKTDTRIGSANYEKDAMRRNVAKSGLKTKGTTPIKINVNPDSAKTPTKYLSGVAKTPTVNIKSKDGIKQSEVSKKAKQFTTKINKANVNRKEFPGDKSGAYKAAKSDLETRKGFSKNKSGGLKADEKNPFVKRSVRKARVDKLRAKNRDFQAMKKKKMTKAEFIKRYPNSQTAKRARGM